MIVGVIKNADFVTGIAQKKEGEAMAKCKNCKVLEKAMDITSKGVNEYTWCPARDDSPDTEIERDCDYYEAMTQADRIRNMSDDELAEIFGLMAEQMEKCYGCPVDKDVCRSVDVSCERAFEKWLKSPVEV